MRVLFLELLLSGPEEQAPHPNSKRLPIRFVPQQFQLALKLRHTLFEGHKASGQLLNPLQQEHQVRGHLFLVAHCRKINGDIFFFFIRRHYLLPGSQKRLHCCPCDEPRRAVEGEELLVASIFSRAMWRRSVRSLMFRARAA